MGASTELKVIRRQVRVRLCKIESVSYVLRALCNAKGRAVKPALKQKLWVHVRRTFWDKSPGALPDLFAVALKSKSNNPPAEWADELQQFNARRPDAADLRILECVAQAWCQAAGLFRTELSLILPKPVAKLMRRKPDVLGALAPLRFKPRDQAVAHGLNAWCKCILKEEGGLPARTPDALLALLTDLHFRPIWPDVDATFKRLEDCCKRLRGKRLAPDSAQIMRAAIKHVKSHQPRWLHNDGPISPKVQTALNAGETEPPFDLSPAQLRVAVASEFEPVDVPERQIGGALREARKSGVLQLSVLEFLDTSSGLIATGPFYRKGNGIGEEVPIWDCGTRSLYFRGNRIKTYRPNAKTQVLILSAFQECDWPPCIDDPLTLIKGTPAKRRLNLAIKDLNRTLSRLEFHGDGSGSRICWNAASRTNRKNR